MRNCLYHRSLHVALCLVLLLFLHNYDSDSKFYKYPECRSFPSKHTIMALQLPRHPLKKDFHCKNGVYAYQENQLISLTHTQSWLKSVIVLMYT